MTITAHRWTADEITQGKDFLDEGRALAAAGDINLASYRLFFQRAAGRPTTLDDDALLTIIGLDSEGDYCPMIETDQNIDDGITEWFVSRVLGIEATTTAVPTTTAVTGKPNPITVVQEDVNGYEVGSSLSEPTDIAKYLSLVFNITQRAAEAPEWKYSDDVIVDIVRRNPRHEGIEDEDYEDTIIEAMTAFDPQMLPDLSAQERINQDALSHDRRIELAASIFNKDTALMDVLARIDTSNKVVMMSSVDVFERIKAMTASGALDFDGLIAEPGTEREHVVGTNKPYDKFIKYVNGKAKTFSEIDGIAMRLLPIANAKAKSADHSDNIKKEYKEAINRADKATEDSTVSVLKRAFREACMLIHQINKFDRFNQYMKDEDGKLVLDKDGNPINPGILRVAIHVDTDNKTRRTTPKPIHIWERTCVTNTASVSVREFNKYRPNLVPVAADLETLMKDYKDSIAERTGETGEGKPLPKNAEEYLTEVNYFATVMSEPKWFKFTQDLLGKGKEDSEELFSALTIAFDRLDLLLSSKRAASGKTNDQTLKQGASK